ncbi:MAG: Cell wall protein AWA1 [Parcubacteria group bacterium GW2011_GWB1_57_6]|nr:MAG: Cell wall protein AWA1 [Parcubacteria group bacterium GW2011_GWA1_56_13]KKW46783.1 MAG: Cell wall protein AWA1 [Parcubacteria group bacterium GW2011_GWB1_57_6]
MKPQHEHFLSHAIRSVFLLAVVVFASYYFSVSYLPRAQASATDSLSGYAWSDNVGWISFNCTNTGSCGTSNYGVTVNPTNGEMSGYAWSDNVGWFSFQPGDVAGCPQAPCTPKVNQGNGTVTGWFRALANGGGWDGWVSLSGVTVSGVAFAGYAWGSDVVGWVSMSGVMNTFTAPTVSCSGAPSTAYIGQQVTWSSSVSGGSGSYTYSWSGTDGLSGTSASTQKTYSTTGTKQGTIAVTDTVSGQTSSASCNAGVGVSVQSCSASLSANPTTVEEGQNTTLSWNVPGGSSCAASCSGSGFNTGGALSGSTNASVPPTPPSTSYGLTCSGGTYGPPPPVNVTVSVVTPTATITANGQSNSARVNPNTPNNTTVAWSSTNASSCAVTKNGNAWRNGLSDPGRTDSVTTQSTYALDCVNDHGTHATDSVIVNVIPGFQEF